MMSSNFEIVVEGMDAQDLYFIEREIPDTKVVEQKIEVDTGAFGMPGVIEAAILIGTAGTVATALAWVLKKRNDLDIIIRERQTADGAIERYARYKASESESSEKTIEQVEKWLASA